MPAERNKTVNRLVAALFIFSLCACSFANPIDLDPELSIGSIMVLVSTIGLESGIAAILLFFFGMAPVQTLCAMLFLNVVTFGFMIYGMLEVIDSIIIIEALIVVIEAAFIKFVSRFDAFQWESFKGIRWRAAFLVSTFSNVASYFVGKVLAARL